MPSVDLEALVAVCGGGGGDNKIACETTLADALSDTTTPKDVPGVVVPDVADEEAPPDFPPESFWLSKDAELDWFDRNAFFERKESTKGSNSNSTNLNPNVGPHSNSNSQRFSFNLKSKAAIIGLPKTQKTNFCDTKRKKCKPPNIQLFPKRSGSTAGKTAAALTEPSSPKVSCMGRVRSKRGRRRPTRTESNGNRSIDRSRSGGGKKTGFCSRIMSLFQSDHRRRRRDKDRPSSKVVEPSEDSASRKSSVSVRGRERAAIVEPVTEAPSLGGLTRFASGRRSQSWSTEDFDVARSHS